MKILGHKPSEIRKAVAGFSAALLVLLVALPAVGLPVAVAGVIATVTAFLTGVSVYLAKPNVSVIIDGLDHIDPPVEYPPFIEKS